MPDTGADLFDVFGLDRDDPAVRGELEDIDAVEQLVATLRDARRQQRLRQADVAAQMETTQSAVSELETTAGNPRISTLQRYARAIGGRVVLRFVADAAHLPESGRPESPSRVRREPEPSRSMSPRRSGSSS